MSSSLALVQADAPAVRAYKPSVSGLVILDHSRDPIYFNAEAVRILAYPESPQALDRAASLVGERISSWIVRPPLGENSAPPEFSSGRRRYVARILTLSSISPSGIPAMSAIVLERAQRRSFDSSQIAAHFNLSQRERETIELVVHGYTSKEIAARMRISPNTVKTFLRLSMVKMGVSTRSGLVGKILATVYLSDQLF